MMFQKITWITVSAQDHPGQSWDFATVALSSIPASADHIYEELKI